MKGPAKNEKFSESTKILKLLLKTKNLNFEAQKSKKLQYKKIISKKFLTTRNFLINKFFKVKKLKKNF